MQALPMILDEPLSRLPDVSEPASDWHVVDAVSAEGLMDAITNFVQSNPDEPTIDELLATPLDDSYAFEAVSEGNGQHVQLYQLDLAAELFAPEATPVTAASTTPADHEDVYQGEQVDLDQFD